MKNLGYKKIVSRELDHGELDHGELDHGELDHGEKGDRKAANMRRGSGFLQLVNHLLSCLALLLLGSLALGSHGVAIARADVEVGQQAPDFSASDLDGAQISLATLKGSYAVLEWSNPGCPYVKKHYYSGNMQRLQKEFLAKGVKWVIVNSSAPGKQGHLSTDAAKEWMKEQEVSGVKMILDGAGIVGKSYGAKTTPQMFVINPQGVVIYAGAIDDDSSASQHAVEAAKNYVAASLNEALAGKPVTVPVTDPYGCSVKYGG